MSANCRIINKVETAGPTLFVNRKFDCILRNPVSDGRGIAIR